MESERFTKPQNLKSADAYRHRKREIWNKTKKQQHRISRERRKYAERRNRPHGTNGKRTHCGSSTGLHDRGIHRRDL
jgi:hypothetical protein